MSFKDWPVLQGQAFPIHLSSPAQGQCLATWKGRASPAPQAPPHCHVLLTLLAMSALPLTNISPSLEASATDAS